MIDRREFLRIVVAGAAGFASSGMIGDWSKTGKFKLVHSVFAESGEIRTNQISTIKNYFSNDYQEARAKFLEACEEAGAGVESFKNPNTGPDNKPLYTDVALLGNRFAESVLVLGSGTHGVEGFAGSAIQNGLLRTDFSSMLKPKMGVVMIHGIEPYGFAHLRRFNEDNIDLNRNFVDRSKAYPENPHYDSLADVIALKNNSSNEVEESTKRLRAYGEEHGQAALREAISGGQYKYPKGLFFGGHSEAWSNKILRRITQKYLNKPERVVFVDFHTGLGPYGKAEIIMNVSKNSPSFQRALKWWGNRVRTTLAEESVSIHLTATLKLAFPKMVPNAEVTAVSLEFGTVLLEKVFGALQAENWLYNHGGKNNHLALKIKTNLRQAFYPDKDDWKVRVWKQGKEVVEQALVHF